MVVLFYILDVWNKCIEYFCAIFSKVITKYSDNEIPILAKIIVSSFCVICFLYLRHDYVGIGGFIFTKYSIQNMAEKEVRSMILSFRLLELQALLTFAGKSKLGKKNELQVSLLKNY